MNSSKKKKKKWSLGILILVHFVEMWRRVVVGASYKKASLVRKGGDEREGDQKSLTMRERETERERAKSLVRKNGFFFCVCGLENVVGT